MNSCLENLHLKNGEHLSPYDLNKGPAYFSEKVGPQLAQELYDFLQAWWSPCPSMVLHSSGSTGQAKAMRASKEHMRASAKMSCDYFGLQAGQSVLLALPLNYIAAQMMIVRALVAGLQLDIRPASAQPLLNDIEPSHYHFATMVPLQAAKTPLETLQNIDCILLGGSFIPPEVEDKLQGHKGKVYASYGMTETLSHIALRRINGAEASPSYTALGGITLRQDAENCLCITAPHLGIHSLQSNDIVQMEATGQFIPLGRRDNIINSGGIKLQAEEIEKTLHAATTLSLVAVAHPHPELGECVALLWEGPTEEEGTLKTAITQKLDKYQQPKYVIHLEALPRHRNGKIARARCKEAMIQKLG